MILNHNGLKMEVAKVSPKGKWHILEQGKNICNSTVNNMNIIERNLIDYLPENLCISCWDSVYDRALSYYYKLRLYDK